MVTYTKLTQTNNATCFKQLYFQHIQANYDIELSKFKWNYTVRTQSTSKSSKNQTNNHQGKSKFGHHDTSCTVAVGVGIITWNRTRCQLQCCNETGTRICTAKIGIATVSFDSFCAILEGKRWCETIWSTGWACQCGTSTFLLFFWLCCPVCTNIAFLSTP